MKVVVKVQDVVALVQRFERAPKEAMQEFVREIQRGATAALEQLMESEVTLFLGQEAERSNKRNGYRVRTYGIKGLGAISIRVPRDRKGRYRSQIIPSHRQYDAGLEKDVALLHLAGLSTRMLSQISQRIFGVSLSHEEVHRSLHELVPQAKAFLERPLSGRDWIYLYVDGTNFSIRRTTVEREPTLVVVGVDKTGRKSILAMIQGDKDHRTAWEMVFARLKERGLDGTTIQLGIMDGLPGLEDAFREAFLQSKTARCWVHKARNVFPLVPRRYQAAFKVSWDQVAYAQDEADARGAFHQLKTQWSKTCGDAVERLEKDLDALVCHYQFPKAHWDALRTTNPIERVNKEFKRRSKSMETLGPDTLKVLLAFTALRLEFGWSLVPISSPALNNLKLSQTRLVHLATESLLN